MFALCYGLANVDFMLLSIGCVENAICCPLFA